MSINNKFWLVVIIIIFFSCHNKEKTEITKYVEMWQNKEIIFTDSLTLHINNFQTKSAHISSNYYKILNYIDTNGCTECKLKLPGWKKIIKEADSLNLNVSFIFIAHLNNYNTLEKQKKINKFSTPIYYDKTGNFEEINKFPSKSPFQTFLLNSQNKVILIGNPVLNNTLWTLYKREINKSLIKNNTKSTSINIP